MSRSWCLLSITGLAALGMAKRYGTSFKAYIIRQIPHDWVIFLLPARRPSVLGHFSSFQPLRLWPCSNPLKVVCPFISRARTRHDMCSLSSMFLVTGEERMHRRTLQKIHITAFHLPPIAKTD